MIVRAAVCPGAPLLIPGLADGLCAEVPDLVEACDRAVGSLRDVDRTLLVTSGPRPRDEGVRRDQVSVVHPAGTVLSSATLTGGTAPAHFTGRLPAAGPVVHDPPPSVPAGVGVIVGAALLARAGIEAPVTAVELAGREADVAGTLAEVQQSTDRVGLLVVAEGSASRGDRSPGGGSADAAALDAALAVALAAGDPDALARAAAVDPASAATLLYSSAPALGAMAELTAARPPRRAELLLDQATLGVGYLVAVWCWSD